MAFERLTPGARSAPSSGLASQSVDDRVGLAVRVLLPNSWPLQALATPPYFGNAAAQQRDRRSAQRGAARRRRSAHRDDGEHVAQVEPHVAGEAVDLRGDVQIKVRVRVRVRGLGLGLGLG